MAIVFDWYENPNASTDAEEKGLHPRIFLNGKVSTEQLCNEIHTRSSLSTGDVKNVFANLAKIFSEELREGREIHLEGIGYFYPTLKSTQRVTRSTAQKSHKLALKTIRFRPDVNLKGALVGIRGSQTKFSRHSQKLTEDEIDTRLDEYFAQHSMMVRTDFQQVCGMARTTAKTHIGRLREEGKLLNIGTRAQPIYVPAPGHYGVAEDAVQRR